MLWLFNLASGTQTVNTNRNFLNSDTILYYKDRAREYEKIYFKPERQNDLKRATEILQVVFNNKEIFEIACGTGYWTERIAKTAKTILATDINDTVIEVAKSKNYSPAAVRFQIADIFNLPVGLEYESIFGGFIWSHIKVEDLNNFIDRLHKLIVKGGIAVFIDNNYVEGSNLPITDIDNMGNTFQTRQLENGSKHKVLKNFPTKKFIRQLLADKASDINIINLKYYWILTYKTCSGKI